MRHSALVAIGASWGGVDALRFLISALTPDFAAPIVVCQHRGDDTDDALAQVLQSDSAIEVREAVDKAVLEAGKVYVAPSGYHVLIEGDTLALSTEGPISWARPSIDVMFQSAAEAYRRKVIAVVLTGAGTDGPDGALAVKANGGMVIVQDPATAESRTLPDLVLATLKPDRVLKLAEIVPFLSRQVREMRSAFSVN